MFSIWVWAVLRSGLGGTSVACGASKMLPSAPQRTPAHLFRTGASTQHVIDVLSEVHMGIQVAIVAPAVVLGRLGWCQDLFLAARSPRWDNCQDRR